MVTQDNVSIPQQIATEDKCYALRQATHGVMVPLDNQTCLHDTIKRQSADLLLQSGQNLLNLTLDSIDALTRPVFEMFETLTDGGE